MATSPVLRAEERITKNCYRPSHASLRVPPRDYRAVQPLPIVLPVRAARLTPLAHPAAGSPEPDSLQPVAASRIRVFGVVLLEPKEEPAKGNKMSGIWIFLLIIGVWILLQAYILPKFGIST